MVNVELNFKGNSYFELFLAVFSLTSEPDLFGSQPIR